MTGKEGGKAMSDDRIIRQIPPSSGTAGSIHLRRGAPMRYHEENKSTETEGRYPWRVTLLVWMDPVPKDVVKAVYYVRAPDWGSAIAMADKLWQLWEKKENGWGDQLWPDTNGPQEAVCLDEGDWAEAWEYCRRKGEEKGNFKRHQGPSGNPSAFVLWNLEYLRALQQKVSRITSTGKLDAGTGSDIIMPGDVSPNVGTGGIIIP
jgi:hypothetical protein